MCSVDIDPRSQIPPKEYTDAFRDAAQPIAMEPIGYVESPYKERFGTPRQPVVTKLTAGGRQEGAIVITRKDMLPHALQDLDGFTHCWLIAHMHLNTGYRSLVRPPRGPKDVKRGLLATRAPHRPNQLSLSALQITHVDAAAGRIGVLGLDLLDGTPVLDVKPYVPPFDSFPEARYGWIEEMSDGDALGADRLDYWPPPAHLDG